MSPVRLIAMIDAKKRGDAVDVSAPKKQLNEDFRQVARWLKHLHEFRGQRTDVAAYAVDFVEQLAEQRQYSLQILTDGSLIQLFYEFAADGKTLRAASLGFFYSGKLTEVSEELEPPLDEIDEVLPDSPADYFAGSWLRVDYDPAAARDCLHYDCHLHSSLSDDMRVAVNRVPTPKQFIELVLAWFYPETYRSNRLPACRC